MTEEHWTTTLNRKRRRAAQTARGEEIRMTTTFRNDEQAGEAIERAGGYLESLTLDAKNTLEAYRRESNAALKDPYVPDAGKAHAVEKLRAKAKADLREIEEKAQAAVGSARVAAEYLARDTRSVAEQARDDARTRMAFDRAEMLLAAGARPHDVVSQAVEAGDKDTIRAMSFYGRTWLEADRQRRGGSKGDYRERFAALDGALKDASSIVQHPAQTAASDLSELGEDVGLISARARREVEGGDPIVSLHADGGDFSETVGIARENAALLNQMGGGDVSRRAS